jgi:hypothetical protein
MALASARAAIEAMREPDPRTSTAIMGAVHRVAAIYDGEVYVRGNAGEFIANAMIDAALRTDSSTPSPPPAPTSPAD